MKKLWLFLFFPVFAFGQTNLTSGDTKPDFFIKGTIEGLADSTMVFITHPGSKAILATDYAKNGAFSLFGNLENSDLYQLSFVGSTESSELFLDKSNITVTGSMKNLQKLAYTGSATQKDYELYQTRFNSVKNRLNSLVGGINKTNPGPSRDSLISQFEKAKLGLISLVVSYVKEKPSSPVSPFIIYITSPVSDDIAALEQRYNLLTATAKETTYGKEVIKLVEASKVGMVGTMAPDFIQADTANSPVALSQFKGKYVLVDFWASWCGPCRMENPAVVNAYQAFKDKNFTILGVSLDQNRDKWLQAIAADQLTWTHVSDLKYWQNAAAQLYHITGIPANMLIDPSGKIVARNLRGDQLYSTLQQLLN